MYPTAIGPFATPPAEVKPSEPYRVRHWQNTMLGHSAANVVPVVASNRVGVEEIGETAMKFHGGSFISDHRGNIEVEMDNDSEGVIVSTFDLDEIAEERRSFPFFRDRRVDLFGRLLTLDGRI